MSTQQPDSAGCEPTQEDPGASGCGERLDERREGADSGNEGERFRDGERHAPQPSRGRRTDYGARVTGLLQGSNGLVTGIAAVGHAPALRGHVAIGVRASFREPLDPDDTSMFSSCVVRS